LTTKHPQNASAPPAHADATARVAARVQELAATYVAPNFAEVPHADAALFLCAIDHRTRYRGRYLVGGKGPYEGSALLWALGLAAERRRPGTLTAAGLVEVDPSRLADLFRIGGETVADPDVRAGLWRDLAAGLTERYGGDAETLIAAAEGRLGGAGGLLARLAEFEAYADPLAK